MNIHHTPIKLLSLLLALLLALPICAAATENDEASRYILLLDDTAELAEVARAVTDGGGEILYTYERLIRGLCIHTAEERDTLDALDGVAAVCIPQIYTMLGESESSGLLSEKELEADRRHAAAAIEQMDGASGAGRVVALLDAGFDIALDCLKLSDNATAKLNEHDVLSLSDSLCADTNRFSYWREVWRRAKVPFAYDYAEGDPDVSAANNSHGNHTAAIIAGNGERNGAAPEAQLLLMKVAVELYGKHYAEESAILAALEDSVTLGADVICLPFGSPQIIGSEGCDGYALSLALEAAGNAGCTIIAAAGNDSARAEATADSPDVSSLCGFAALTQVITVGSSDYFMRTLPCLETEDGLRFLFTDTGEDVSGESFVDALKGRRLEIVAIPGDGSPEDFVGLELIGKLALIKRGNISFADKVNHAEAAGALGVIVFNNEPEEALVNMQLDRNSIPAVFVSLEVGEKLSGSFLLVDDGYMQVEVEGGGLVSSSSSRGDGERAKPDLVAFGAWLNPPDAESVYDTVNGSSYAAALAAGYAAALLSYRDFTPEELRLALTNTASILESGDTPLSTRAQGAGRISLASAAERTLSLATEEGDGSLSFGNLEEETTFSLILTNHGDTTRTLVLKASPTVTAPYSYRLDRESGMLLPSDESDGDYPYYVGDTQLPLEDVSILLGGHELNRFSTHTDPYTLILAPDESVKLSLTLDLSDFTLPEAYPNGCYIEGFIEVIEDEIKQVSLPFCGFSGEHEALPLVGSLSLSSHAANHYLFGECKLGANAFDEFSIDKAPFSPNRDGSYESVSLDIELLRAVDDLRFELLTEDGECLLASRSYTDLVGAAAQGSFTIELWDGSDPENERYLYSDGDYILRLFLRDGEKLHTIERILTIDTEKPSIEALELTQNALVCHFDDRVGIQYVCAYAIDRSGFFRSFHSSFVPSAEECADFTHSFDLRELPADVNCLYVEVCDYAFNSTVLRISIGEVSA